MSSLILSTLMLVMLDGKPTIIHHTCSPSAQTLPVIDYETENRRYIRYLVECYHV